MAAEPLTAHQDLPSDPRLGTDQGAVITAVPRDEVAERVLRRLNGLGIFMLGPSNVVIQLAWPEIGYAVANSPVESGNVAKHPFKRYRTTIGYLGIAMWGSEELRRDYREAVNKQHRPVRSGPGSPVKYNAFNRDLQLWVASCLYYGMRDILVRMGGPLTDEEEEAVLRYSSRYGTTLQVTPEMWHRDRAAFDEYWAAGLERVAIDERVRDYLIRILDLRILPAPLRMLFGKPLLWSNTGFLPPEVRDAMGLEWTEQDQRRHDVVLRTIGRLTSPLPFRLRTLPVDLVVWNIRLRRRLGKPMA